MEVEPAGPPTAAAGPVPQLAAVPAPPGPLFFAWGVGNRVVALPLTSAGGDEPPVVTTVQW